MRTITPEIFSKFVGWDVDRFCSGTKKRGLDRIEVKISRMSELVGRQARMYLKDGSMGSTSYREDYFLIFRSGQIMLAPKASYHQSSNYAHSDTVEEDGVTLGDGWDQVSWDNARFIIQFVSNYDCWEGSRQEDEVYLIVHIIREDDVELVRKIRRRCEDALRKSDPTTIIKIASILEVGMNE